MNEIDACRLCSPESFQSDSGQLKCEVDYPLLLIRRTILADLDDYNTHRFFSSQCRFTAHTIVSL